MKGVKRIKHYGVFVNVQIIGIITYAWIFVAMTIVSKDMIEIWEAIITLVLYFLMLIYLYIFDKFISKKQKNKVQIATASA